LELGELETNEAFPQSIVGIELVSAVVHLSINSTQDEAFFEQLEVLPKESVSLPGPDQLDDVTVPLF